MEFFSIVGIDVSKLTLDVHVLPGNQYFQTDNNEKGIKQLLDDLVKELSLCIETTLFAFEHTGFYSHQLSVQLQERGCQYVLIPGLELKRSLGITRSKTDRVDAKKIAHYTYLRKDEITPSKLPEDELVMMKRYLLLRDKLVRQRAGFKTTLSEAKRALKKQDYALYYSSQESIVKHLTGHIIKLEEKLMSIVEDDPKLYEQFNLIVSIPSVGKITALTMIAFTHAFSRFANARKFACYAGIAPFPYQSGTSIKGNTKVSHLAYKKIKSLLSLVASCAIQHNPELKQYYKQRIDKGKNKMSSLNIIRNKVVARIFAVVERGTPYVDTMKYAA